MRAALIRLGLSNVAAQEFINNGVDSTHRLRLLSTEDLDKLIKQIHRDNTGTGLFIPFMAQAYIRAIRFWANRMYILGADFDETLIDREMAQIWSATMKEEAEAAKTPIDIVKAPEPFKKDTKWKVWKETITTYLHSKIGQASIPLAYIIREFDAPIPGLIYPTAHDQLVAGAILIGPEYHRNNGTVYDLLQSLTVNGPAWPWINAYQRTRDGRKAWKSLVSYYEGDSMRTRSKQECYDAIAKAHYQGPRRNYDFSTYVHTHQQAHQELIRLGEPIPENKKVRDFLHGITDPQCATIKLSVLSNTALMNDFSQAINYIASAIDMVTKNTHMTTARQISDMNSFRNNRGRGRGRSERGRGFNRGRGGRFTAVRYTGRGLGWEKYIVEMMMGPHPLFVNHDEY
jgi:hypothetical protein